MCPRPYNLGKRQAAADETRSRVVTAARELLMEIGGYSGFTIDAVAERAGVARMTVYNAFGGKEQLLEAVFDSLALAGGMDAMSGAFRLAEPLNTLREFIRVLTTFWASGRVLGRRLRGLALLDPRFEEILSARQARRREGLAAVLARVAAAHGRPRDEAMDEAVDALTAITSFETYDTLAAAGRSTDRVAALVYELCLAAIGVTAATEPAGAGDAAQANRPSPP